MRHQFSLFQSHLDLAHVYWKKIVLPNDLVIDATCGNGHDTVVLARLASEGVVYAIDVQEKAIQATRDLLKDSLSNAFEGSVRFFNQSHESFPNEIQPKSVKLIVYNLGYLPGGNKENTTLKETTVQSIENAKNLISAGGAISITCYPGHPQGAEEEKAILEMVSTWNPSEWSCCHHRWLNRKASPSLLLLQKNVVMEKSSI